MANKKITELPSDSMPEGDDVIPFVDTTAGRTEQVTLTNLAASAPFTSQFATSGAPFSPFAALRQALTNGAAPLGVTVFGDSTGNGTDEWVYEQFVTFGSDYPEYTVRYWRYDPANDAWDFAETLQTGSDGEPYVSLDGTGDYVSTPHSTGLAITGDIDVRIRCSLTDWTPSSDQTVFSKYGAAGQRGWRLFVSTDGTLRLQTSTDGTAIGVTAVSSVAPTVSNGDALWLRATLDVDNGASGKDVKFYTSADGVSWSQLGSTQTSASTTTISNNTSTPVLLGGYAATGQQVGRVMQAEVRNGIGGPVVAAFDAGMYVRSTTLKGVTGETWTLVADAAKAGSPTLFVMNGSVSGQVLAYSNDATRFAKLTAFPTQVAFISYGHNDSATGTMAADYATLVDAIRAKHAGCGVVAMQQNPQASPRTAAQIADQRYAQMVTVPTVAAGRRCSFVGGVYEALDADTATYISGDGVHPTAAGSDVWGALALAALRNA